MITWNLDPTNCTQEQLERLLDVVESIDYSIAKQLIDYLTETYNT